MKPVDLVVDVPCRTGEAPLWHHDEACVYWMDIPNGHLFRYSVASGQFARVLAGPVIGALTLQRDGTLAVLGIHGGTWLWKDQSLQPVFGEIPAVRGTRFNDAVADSMGRILSGTMPTSRRTSTLFAIEPNGDCRELIVKLGQSNGMAFSADQRTLYHVDTRARVVRAYAYDGEAGLVSSPTVLAQLEGSEGVPDGMAIDEEGMLWVALWGGGAVVRLDSRGNEIARLRVPVPQVSSVAFGGADLSELYITTAGGDDRARYGPLAGSLFRARPGVRGLSPNRSALLEPVPNAKPSWPPPSSCSVAGKTRDMPPPPSSRSSAYVLASAERRRSSQVPSLTPAHVVWCRDGYNAVGWCARHQAFMNSCRLHPATASYVQSPP